MGQERSIFYKIDLMPGSYLIFTEFECTISIMSLYKVKNSVSFPKSDSIGE